MSVVEIMSVVDQCVEQGEKEILITLSENQPVDIPNNNNSSDSFKSTFIIKSANQGVWKFIRGLSGQCLSLKNFLDSIPDSHFNLLLKAADAILRGISQVVFVSNPISGFLILLSLFSLLEYGHWEVGVSVLACSAVALLTAISYQQPRHLIQDGITQFNAVLVGSVVMSLYLSIYYGDIGMRCWILVLFGASITVILQTALSNILSVVQVPFLAEKLKQEKTKSYGIAPLTLPFNFVCCVIMGILVRMLPPDAISDSDSSASLPLESPVEWERVMEGSILSMGQVYGVKTLPGSILMFFGVAIFSPLLALVEFLGALLGSLMAVGVTPAPYDDIYSGVWGYCSLLTAGAVGGVFIVPTPSSIPATLLAVASTTALQAFLAPIFQVANIPVFTFPFVLTTWVFLLLTTENGTIARTEAISTPEKHFYQWMVKNANATIKEEIL